MRGHPFLHFKTITKHRHIVMRHCFKAGIPCRGLTHDLSKYSPTEFRAGAAHYADSKRSPTEREREDYGYSAAFMHHKGRNRHHFEYWTDYSAKTKRLSPVKMPSKFVIEMFCDRVGASKVYKGKDYYDGSAYDYFMASKARFNMHPTTSRTLERLLFILKNDGEKAVFKYIRKNLVKIRVTDITSANLSRAAKLYSDLVKENCFYTSGLSGQAVTPKQAKDYLLSGMKAGTKFGMALYGKRPAGCIAVNANIISDLAVKTTKRRKGIGEALLIYAVENCEGMPTIFIPAGKKGAYALNFLYNRGFEDIETDIPIAGTRKLILTERLVERSGKRGL